MYDVLLMEHVYDGVYYYMNSPYAGQGSKPIPFFQFTTRLGRHILVAQSAQEPIAAKVWHTYKVSHTIITKFW